MVERYLCYFNLSVAFDTFDHDVLLQWLQDLGMWDSPLTCFKSYLTDRHQCVGINLKGQCSHEHRLPFGVFQGSVLGPILFTLYTSPLGPIASANGLKCNLYAEDPQLYISFNSSSKLSE